MGAKKKTPWWALILAVAFVVIFLNMCDREQETPSTTTRSPSTTTTTTSRQEPRNIKASVSFTGTQFVITNRESRDWINVRFEVNPGLLSSGYTLKVRKVEAGSAYTVGAMQFANSKGERFNPLLQKPKEFHVLDFGTPWPEQYELEGIAILGWD